MVPGWGTCDATSLGADLASKRSFVVQLVSQYDQHASMVFEASCLFLPQHLLIAHIAADAFLHTYSLVEAGGPTGVHSVDI